MPRDSIAISREMVKKHIACLTIVSMLLVVFFVEYVGALPLGDLRADEVKLVQVVVEPKALVMNKSTVLLVQVYSTFSTRVYADLRVTYDFGMKSYYESGPEGIGVPFDPGSNFLYLPGGNCTADPDWWLTLPAWFTWSMQGTDAAIRVDVDPNDELDETNEQNNEVQPAQFVDVVKSTPMKILFGDAVFNGDVPFYHEGLNIEYLQDVYPLYNGAVTHSHFQAASYSTLTPGRSADDVARSKTSHALALGYDRLVIVYHSESPAGRASGILQVPENRVCIAVSDFGILNWTYLIAHELGHTYYLWHPHDIGIFVNESTCYWPWAKDYGRPGSTFMSYEWKLPENVPIYPRWVDEQRYQSYPKTWLNINDPYTVANGTWQWNLFDQFTTPLVKVEALIIVTGNISREGDVTLDPVWYKINNSVPDLLPTAGAPQSGNHSIRLKDNAGNVLADLPFNVVHKYAYRDDLTGAPEIIHPDSVPFVFKVELAPGTQTIEIVNASTGTVSASRTASSSTPTVHVTSPNGGDHVSLGSECPVKWEANDPDSAVLRFLVACSSDNGGSWAPIADSLTDTNLAWNTSGLEPGTEYLVKVIASDGFNMAEDASNSTFSILDTTSPTTTVTLSGVQGVNDWYVSQVGVNFSAKDNHAVNWTECKLNDGLWSVWSGTYNITTQGNNTLFFRSVDKSGNAEDEQSVPIKIDFGVPFISISSPFNGSTTSTEDVALMWTGFDAVSGVDAYYVMADGGNWISVGRSTGYTFNDLAEGQHTLSVRAVDYAGNFDEKSVLVTVEAAQETDWLLPVIAAAAAVVIISAAYILLRRKKS